MLRHHRTRLLADETSGFWIESIANESNLIDQLIDSGARVGVAFRTQTTKVLLATSILCREPAYQVNRDLKVEALLLAYPNEIKSVQRRANYRVAIPAEGDLMVQVWRIPEHHVLRDKPSATLLLPVRLRDLSTGGMGVFIPPKDGEPVKLAADQRLRIAITRQDDQVLVEGRTRHMQLTPDRSLRLGIQFKKLEDNLEGRQTLAKLTHVVGQLHREEVRRMRLGL